MSDLKVKLKRLPLLYFLPGSEGRKFGAMMFSVSSPWINVSAMRHGSLEVLNLEQ